MVDPMDAVGDPTRRAVLSLVARSPSSVGALAAQLPVSRPAVSQHLRVLKDAGLVSDHAIGTRRIYRLEPTGVQRMRDYLDELWGTALEAFHEAAAAEAAAGTNDEEE
jgi:DNA-binding transcriptional ArsR family regulator